ncbi:hypothetical protein PUN28_015084 [Cardiocondyla obscurior]
MKFFELFVCVMAIATIALAKTNATVTNLALYSSALSDADLQQCYTSANLTEANVIKLEEIKDESYKKAENTDRTKKSGCLILCILRKRGQIVDSEIQKKKFYSKIASAFLSVTTQVEMSTKIDNCINQVQTYPDMCDKSFNLITCIWKDML